MSEDITRSFKIHKPKEQDYGKWTFTFDFGSTMPITIEVPPDTDADRAYSLLATIAVKQVNTALRDAGIPIKNYLPELGIDTDSIVSDTLGPQSDQS